MRTQTVQSAYVCVLALAQMLQWGRMDMGAAEVEANVSTQGRGGVGGARTDRKTSGSHWVHTHGE